ncbi:polysaccharide deacetylase family protein [Flavobacterium sp. UBA6135]|uniref:polysaccharide deacetylase family protein n=1 Tax=Flavobacterium sp. UBA6135 TaxID=1946553 RepID=UPI0025BCA740|nr:polysaccharide deacetylase family protein [Flavobacterium sp. UBA6135]
MNILWIKTNQIIKTIFSNYVWDIPNNEKKVYLTFDDGPTPKITEWVLEQLKTYNYKATFFCIGNNIEKYPGIFNKLITEGHAVGNHTFNHVKGWNTANRVYLKEVEQCEEEIQKSSPKNIQSKLFRPPYGKIKPLQSQKLRKQGYKIIMWDVLSVDYNTTITKEKCLKNVLKNVASGSIIVFHDSIKAFPNLEYALPKTLQFLSENGYRCERID